MLTRRSFAASASSALAALILPWHRWARAAVPSIQKDDGQLRIDRDEKIRVVVMCGPHAMSMSTLRPDEMTLAGAKSAGIRVTRVMQTFLVMNPDHSKWGDTRTLNMPPDDINDSEGMHQYMKEAGRRKRAAGIDTGSLEF